MRKLIRIRQLNKIECSNCDYHVVNHNPEMIATDIEHFINRPCPKCFQNLLTRKEYINTLRSAKIINILNKYFSWLTWFIR